MYIKKQNNGGNDWLETRDEWELELERGQNRGRRKKLDYYEEDEEFDEDIEGDAIDEWFEDDLSSLPSDKEEDFNWDDL
tara:strand:+ start:116 stop:352 length:237 start_codon:yes stop_codon:yes gene_type:complete